MNALKAEFATSVHALALKTFTPEKWENEKSKYQGELKSLSNFKKSL